MTAPVVDPGEAQPAYADDLVTVYQGDCLDVLRELAGASVDAVCTDPPYGLEFMGKEWDSFKPASARLRTRVDVRTNPTEGKSTTTTPESYVAGTPYQIWCTDWARECLRVLKPGGHLLAFGGSRTWHRLAVAVEDAGFEIRDSIAWLYGSGFPKSLDVSKAIDKAARGVPQGGADPTSPNHGGFRTTKTEGKRWDGDSGQSYGAGGSRFLADGVESGSDMGPAVSGAAEIAPDAQRWQGWGTALKPAFEPIVVGRRPLAGTVATNVLEHGTGALNIDACRIATDDALTGSGTPPLRYGGENARPFHQTAVPRGVNQHDAGRWPANVVLDESQAAELDEQSGVRSSGTMRAGTERQARAGGTIYGADTRNFVPADTYGDSGGASRFFYVAKAPSKERPRLEDGTAHPTVKPLTLMRWLVRLVTPPGGVVLDPFLGSGTTAEACVLEGFRCIGIERDLAYVQLAVARLSKPIEPVLFGEPA